MSEIILSVSTGCARVDEILHGVAGIFETAFMRRVRSYYVDGSYADRAEVATSDIDLTIVFKHCFASDERDSAGRVAGYCGMLSSVELDIELVDEMELAEGVYPSLKLGSLCVYGEDRRDHMAILPIDEWIRQRMHAAYWLLVAVFNRPRTVTYPVGYPDPTGSFYGYDQRLVRLPSGAEVHSTRDLIRVTGWIATALVARRAGVYVARKSDCHRAYRQYIGDEWATLVEDIYRVCRTECGYLIPDDAAAQKELRSLCEQTLSFENHFLMIYKHYLLDELQGNSEHGRSRALWVVGQIAFQDPEVQHAIAALKDQSQTPI